MTHKILMANNPLILNILIRWHKLHDVKNGFTISKNKTQLKTQTRAENGFM